MTKNYREYSQASTFDNHLKVRSGFRFVVALHASKYKVILADMRLVTPFKSEFKYFLFGFFWGGHTSYGV